MKPIVCVMLAFSMLFIASSVFRSGGAVTEAAGGETYVWEKEGFGGEFTIRINRDGTYEYYEGSLSSYIGYGKWEEADGILTLEEEGGADSVYRFSVGDGRLVYLAEESGGFMYADVEDGDVFALREE